MDHTSRNILRYALGTTLLVAISSGFGWLLSYLLPILSLSFFASDSPPPKLKGGIIFLLAIWVSLYLALWFTKLFLGYPLLFFLLLNFILFLLFYTNSKYVTPLIRTWLIISFALVPIMGLASQQLILEVSLSMALDSLLAIVFTWLIFAFIPWKGKLPEPPPAPKNDPVDDLRRFRSAGINVLIFAPVLLVFYLFNLQTSILSMIFIALFLMQPNFGDSFKAGGAMILGNLAGGILSIIAYELLTIVPEFSFFLLLVFLAGLLLGKQVFSGKPAAPLYGMAFSTFLLILCSTTSGDAEAGSKVWTRVFQIFLAVFYVVSVRQIINHYQKPKIVPNAA